MLAERMTNEHARYKTCCVLPTFCVLPFFYSVTNLHLRLYLEGTASHSVYCSIVVVCCMRAQQELASNQHLFEQDIEKVRETYTIQKKTSG